MPLVSQFFRPRDPIEEIRLRMAALELSRMVVGAAVTVNQLQWPACLAPVRQDWIIIGARGAGKTALAVAVGQELAAVLEQPLLAVGVPQDVAGMIGARSVRSMSGHKDAVLLLDEAALRVRPGKSDAALWETLSLARHRNVSVLWTSQTLAAVSRDILRLEAIIASRRVDPWSTKWEREEVADWMAQLVAIQTQQPLGLDEWVGFTDGAWCRARTPLPKGWCDRVSRMWR